MRTGLVCEARLQTKLYGSPTNPTDLSRVGADRGRDSLQRPPLSKEFQHAQSLPSAL